MVITGQLIFKLSSILALISTILLLSVHITGTIDVPIPAIIILTFTSISGVSVAFFMDKEETK
ncbi:hypothetical protein [Virgibacillus sediminis]|uniref:Group-specific protein n=1 Tax=Virgibacillus sediminis TaxID=202260 RepID=A0ABV7A1L2_9BACI